MEKNFKILLEKWIVKDCIAYENLKSFILRRLTKRYGLEAFYFVADQLSLLSPHETHRPLWNRGFNLRGDAGNNVPLDLIVEHNNNTIKDLIFNQGANVFFDSAQVVNQASQGIKAACMCWIIWTFHLKLAKNLVNMPEWTNRKLRMFLE